MSSLSIFQPIIQDENQVTFTKMLDKNDRFVNPQEQTAVEIWSHFRAYISYPGTCFLDNFWGEVKILESFIHPLFMTLEDVKATKSEVKINPSFQNWRQIKYNKQNLIFLVCKNKTLLQIKSLKLTNGQKIDLAGFQFQNNKI